MYIFFEWTKTTCNCKWFFVRLKQEFNNWTFWKIYQWKIFSKSFSPWKSIQKYFSFKNSFLNTLHVHVKYLKIYMKKWSKPFNNFLIIKKDIIKFWYWCYVYGIVELFTKLYIDVQDIYVPFFYCLYFIKRDPKKSL